MRRSSGCVSPWTRVLGTMSQRGPGRPPDKDAGALGTQSSGRARPRPTSRCHPPAVPPDRGCALGPAAGGGGNSALPPPPARPRFRPRQLTLPGSGPARPRARGTSGAATPQHGRGRGERSTGKCPRPHLPRAARPGRRVPAPGTGSGCRSLPAPAALPVPLPVGGGGGRDGAGFSVQAHRTAPRHAAQVSPPSPRRCPEPARREEADEPSPPAPGGPGMSSKSRGSGVRSRRRDNGAPGRGRAALPGVAAGCRSRAAGAPPRPCPGGGAAPAQRAPGGMRSGSELRSGSVRLRGTAGMGCRRTREICCVVPPETSCVGFGLVKQKLGNTTYAADLPSALYGY